MNKVELQGRIQRIFVGRRISIITLFVHGYKNNFPQVTFTGEGREVLENYKVGDFVNIKGTIKTRALTNIDGERYFEQFVKGLEITPAKTDMSEKFGKELGGSYNYSNEVLLEGEVVFSTSTNGVANILIKPDDEKFNVWVTSFANNPEKVVEENPAGSRICVKGEIQTVRKESNGNVRFYENIVIRETVNM